MLEWRAGAGASATLAANALERRTAGDGAAAIREDALALAAENLSLAASDRAMVATGKTGCVDQTTRWIAATFLSRIVAVPNTRSTAAEEIFCAAATDVAADAIESAVARAGGAERFFREAVTHEKDGELERWFARATESVGEVELPLVDGDATPFVRVVLALATRRYLSAKKRRVQESPLKNIFTKLIGSPR